MKSCLHSFNTDLAKKYGIEEAIFIHNFQFWINHNIANNEKNYDGRTWTRLLDLIRLMM